VWDVRAGEVLRFGGAEIDVTLVKKSGQLARLSVAAPAGEKIVREVAAEREAEFVPSMAP
jgi:sRNA-binding carbon storage regulator CsrA